MGEPRGTTVSETAQEPYSTNSRDSTDSTDVTDYKGVLKHHYGIALRRFLKWFALYFLMCAVFFVAKSDYLLPLVIVGTPGAALVTIAFYSRMSVIRRCSRVLRTYPLVFRHPVEKVKLDAGSSLHLRFGDRTGTLATMLAKCVVERNGWPKGIADGVWFAGDDLFGGAAIVPGTRELLFMQPSHWALLGGERESAGEARIRQAAKAGIKRSVSY